MDRHSYNSIVTHQKLDHRRHQRFQAQTTVSTNRARSPKSFHMSTRPSLGRTYPYRIDSFANFGTVTCSAENIYGHSGPCAYHILAAGKYLLKPQLNSVPPETHSVTPNP